MLRKKTTDLHPENLLEIHHEELAVFSASDEKSEKNIVVLFSNLRKNLERDFLLAYYEQILHDFLFQETLPKTIIFMYDALQTLQSEAILQSLSALSEQNISILICKKSLEYLQIVIEEEFLHHASIHEINTVLLNADLLIEY